MKDAIQVHRIMILVSFANFGGAQIAALRLARGLRDRGYDPMVCFLYERRLVDSPDHPYEVLLRSNRPGVFGYLAIARGLFPLIWRERPDAVVTFLPFANVLGQVAALCCGAKRRIPSHRMPMEVAHPLLRVLDAALAWTGVYTRVVTVSDAVRRTVQYYPSWLLRRTLTVHNGLRDWKSSQFNQKEVRIRLGIPLQATVLVAVGRLSAEKNYPIMIEIIKRLDGVVLLIAGDGPLRPEIERLVQEANLGSKIRLLGSVARADIPDLLAAADYFIQTSTSEGQSNAVLEALHAGLPLLAHDIPGQRETIADPDGEVAGALIPLNDLEAWVTAIESFRRDPQLREQACLRSRRRAALFSYNAMIDKFERAIVAPSLPV